MKELIKKHEEFDKRMNANDDKINQMMQFADRLNDENHYAADKITEKARSIDERQAKILLSLLVCYLFVEATQLTVIFLLSPSFTGLLGVWGLVISICFLVHASVKSHLTSTWHTSITQIG